MVAFKPRNSSLHKRPEFTLIFVNMGVRPVLSTVTFALPFGSVAEGGLRS